MTITREALDYVRRFWGKVFVISPDPKITEESIEANLHDLLLIADIGIQTILILPNSYGSIAGQQVVGYTDANCQPRIAAETAVKSGASKLIYLCVVDGIHNSSDQLINRLDLEGAQALLIEERTSGKGPVKVVTRSMRDRLESAIWACQQGVERVHFVSGTTSGLMLAELFTSIGTGTMVTHELKTYERVTSGTPEDRERITAFLSSCGIRSSVHEINPDNFIVLHEDDEIRGTICLTLTGQTGHLTYIAVSNHLCFDETLTRLLKETIPLAKAQSARELIISLERNQSWLLVSPVLSQTGFTLGDNNNWHLVLD